jgi:hypothetical protein
LTISIDFFLVFRAFFVGAVFACVKLPDATQFDCSGSWFRTTGARYLRGSILGQGDIDMPRVLAMIKKSGFEGNIFIEYEGMEDCKYGTKVSLENLKRLYAEA